MKKASITLCSLLLAGPALAGPDFTTPSPHGSALTASDGTRDMLPSDDLIFAHDSATLTESGRAQLDTIARYLKTRRDLRLVVEGYTDRAGDAAYNLDLATRRANAARSYLIGRGIAEDRLVLAVFGEAMADDAVNPLDRRVVVYASPRPARDIATNLLDIRRAISATWTANKTLHTEERSARTVRITRR